MNDKDLQIARIQAMESLLDESLELVNELSDVSNKLKTLIDKTKVLSTYYEGPLWRKDFEDDEKNLLPQGLKRGVLSEDAIYNLLSDVDSIYQELEEITKAVK